MRDTLTQEQLGALQRFADTHGRNWKSSLVSAWETGRYQGLVLAYDAAALQEVRNDLGPAWLARFKLTAAKDAPKGPFRLYDSVSAYQSGSEEAGYFDARSIHGDERAHEDGTIATLAEAVELRKQVAEMYHCDVEFIEIRDADGYAVRGPLVSATPYFYRPIEALGGRVLKCAGIADDTNRSWMMEVPGTIELVGYRGDRIHADTHKPFDGYVAGLITEGAT